MKDLDPKNRSEKIAAMNDNFRQSLIGGRVVTTAGVAALDETTLALIVGKVRTYTAFTPANDPYGEHDFGSLSVAGRDLFWKIDYYDPSLTRHSDDASDPAVTIRVLTIMLTEEY